MSQILDPKPVPGLDPEKLVMSLDVPEQLKKLDAKSLLFLLPDFSVSMVRTNHQSADFTVGYWNLTPRTQTVKIEILERHNINWTTRWSQDITFPGNGTIHFKFNWGPLIVTPPNEQVEIAVVVDRMNVIAEKNEANNYVSETYNP